MRFCEWGVKCGDWAQWRATWPDKRVLLFCDAHKKIHEETHDEQVKYNFVGAVPAGGKP